MSWSHLWRAMSIAVIASTAVRSQLMFPLFGEIPAPDETPNEGPPSTTHYYDYETPATERPVLTTTTATAQKSVCLEPPVTGLCRAYFVRYFYNHATKNCETFAYGGCGGNANNFQDRAACMHACMSVANNGPATGRLGNRPVKPQPKYPLPFLFGMPSGPSSTRGGIEPRDGGDVQMRLAPVRPAWRVGKK